MDKINFWKNKKVFITGNTGFKGTWLTKILLQKNAIVKGYSSKIEKKSMFNLLNLKNKIKFDKGDIRNYKTLFNSINDFDPDVIFHLAAQPLVSEAKKYPLETISTNIIGTTNLLDILKFSKKRKSIVIVTTDKCYQEGIINQKFSENDKLGGDEIYSASKASCELITYSYNKSFFSNYSKVGLATARSGNVIGGGDWSLNRLVPDIFKSIIKKKKLEVRNPNHVRPWLHVLDPLYGYMILAEKLYKFPKEYSSSWNFGPNGKPNSVIEVLDSFKKFTQLEFTIKNSKKNNFYESSYLILNSYKSKKYLKWKPLLNTNDSVRLCAEWLNDYINQKNMNQVTDKQINYYNNLR